MVDIGYWVLGSGRRAMRGSRRLTNVGLLGSVVWGLDCRSLATLPAGSATLSTAWRWSWATSWVCRRRPAQAC